MRKSVLFLLAICLFISIFAGCGGDSAAVSSSGDNGKKTFVFGDTTFNAENEEMNINPHEAYCGWACIRYGVGETLFRISDTSELEPWLAAGYELVDENTWKITIKDGVHFSNGKACDAAAVKESIAHLIKTHDRARGDLRIASMEAAGNVLTIVTETPNPTLLNYLSEPYGCVIDVEAGSTDDGMVVGTGPYVATELVTNDHLHLVKNENYWGGEVHVDDITVRNISDGDTLAMALQSGEIDAAYGMAYASYPLFENEKYAITGIQTSRAFYCQINFASPIMQDAAVRKAIAMGIDKEGFVNTLLRGYGYVGKGAFPESFPFGGQHVTAPSYDPEGARAVLEEAGWRDTDGDGVREKNGVKLSVKWLTYPSRQELPLLAESAQATLKEIGIEVIPNVTASHNALCKDTAAWDIYATASVNCGLGDPMNFFSTYCLDASVKNRGQYHSDALELLAKRLNSTFDADERARLAIAMQQELLHDNAFIFCSFLRMSMIAKANVTGLKAHSCDFYELTSDLDI